MATNYIGPGKVMHVTTATGGVTGGTLHKTGDTLGIVDKTTVAGSVHTKQLEGVFTIAKIAAANTSLAVGQLVYARATGSLGVYKVLGIATGNPMGTAMQAAATGATTAVVKLHGFATN